MFLIYKINILRLKMCYEEEVYILTDILSKFLMANRLDMIQTVRKIDHKGGKYKWALIDSIKYVDDGIIMFESVCIKYYDDNLNMKSKLNVSTTYSLSRVKNIKRDEILNLLQAKERKIKIRRLLS